VLVVLCVVYVVGTGSEKLGRRGMGKVKMWANSRYNIDASVLWKMVYTRKNAQVVTNLQQTCSNAVPTTCQQDVFALLVPSLLTSCQRLVDNLLQGC
jgi:hypothetical protein